MAKTALYALFILLLATCDAAESAEKGFDFSALSKPIRLILSDFDMTLTDSSLKFVESNVDGFKLAHKLGIQVAIVTGRGPEYVRTVLGDELMKQIGYSGSPGIYFNGTYLTNAKGEVVADAPFEKGVVRRLVGALQSQGVKKIILGSSKVAQVEFTGTEDLDADYYTIFAIDDKVTLDRARALAEKEFAEEVGFFRNHPTALGAHRSSFDKGFAVRRLAEDMGISLDEVLVMGDNDNDLAMFGVGAISVAVGNAQQALKDKADYVTVDSSEGALLAVVKELEQRHLYPGAASAVASKEEVGSV